MNSTTAAFLFLCSSLAVLTGCEYVGTFHFVLANNLPDTCVVQQYREGASYAPIILAPGESKEIFDQLFMEMNDSDDVWDIYKDKDTMRLMPLITVSRHGMLSKTNFSVRAGWLYLKNQHLHSTYFRCIRKQDF